MAMMMGMPAAHADSSPPDSWTVVFDGDARFVQTGPDGPTVPSEYAETLTLDCTADGCEYTNANPLFPPVLLALSGDAPTTTTSWASSGDFCEGTGLAAGTATATVADRKLTIEITTDGFGWQDCAHGRDYGFAQALTLTADWQSGDLCPLTPAGCAGEASAGDSDAAAGVATDADDAGEASDDPAGGSSSRLGTGSSAAPSVRRRWPRPRRRSPQRPRRRSCWRRRSSRSSWCC